MNPAFPDHERHGQPILIRADGVGAPGAWLGHLHQLRTEQCLDLDYSVGFTMTDAAWQAILACPSAPGPRQCRSTEARARALASPS